MELQHVTIRIEGPDKSGKSQLALLLAQFLKDQGANIIYIADHWDDKHLLGQVQPEAPVLLIVENTKHTEVVNCQECGKSLTGRVYHPYKNCFKCSKCLQEIRSRPFPPHSTFGGGSIGGF